MLTEVMSSDVIWLDSCESTNDEALKIAREGKDDVVVIADGQTAGRGRRGRTWESPPGGLYMSLVHQLGMRRTHSSLIDIAPWVTLAVGVAVCDALDALGVKGQLKWPNDVVFEGKKLAGVLVEAVPGAPYAAVIGVGVNVANTLLPFAATSVDEARHAAPGEGTDRGVLAAAVRQHVRQWIHDIEDYGVERLREEWRRRMDAKSWIRFTGGLKDVVGRQAYLYDDGAISVRDVDGCVQVVTHGELSIL